MRAELQSRLFHDIALSGDHLLAWDPMTEIVSPLAAGSHARDSIQVRRALAADLPEVIALDEAVTGVAKAAYWQDVFERYGERRLHERFFLVAEAADEEPSGRIVGLIIGEIRAWEFGSEPCGWVFAFSVRPQMRLKGVGRSLFAAMSEAFRQVGVRTMRTMVARENTLHMTFFRSEGMMAGPYLQLEKSLDENPEEATF